MANEDIFGRSGPGAAIRAAVEAELKRLVMPGMRFPFTWLPIIAEVNYLYAEQAGVYIHVGSCRFIEHNMIIKPLDVELRNDDVVFVGQQRQFYVYGEVRRPGAYPMEPDLNVMRVLSISGGVTERGSLRRIRISRKGMDQKIQEFKSDMNTPILSGDVVFVDERLF